jgi:hypothetical protein
VFKKTGSFWKVSWTCGAFMVGEVVFFVWARNEIHVRARKELHTMFIKRQCVTEGANRILRPEGEALKAVGYGSHCIPKADKVNMNL